MYERLDSTANGRILAKMIPSKLTTQNTPGRLPELSARIWFMPVAFVILLWACAVRVPFAGTVGEDEVFYALVAQRWLAGLLPYASSFDVKPPGLFALFAAAQAVFGTSIQVVKGFEVGCVAITAFMLFLIGKRHLSNQAGWLAAALYPVYSLVLSGVDAPTELVKAPFEAVAVLAILESLCIGSPRLLLVATAGLLMGAAGMVKQTTAFPAVAVLVALLWQCRDRRAWTLSAYGFGLAVAPAGFGLAFLAVGQLPALFAGAVMGAARRLGIDNISFGAGVLRFLPGTKPLLMLMLPALLVITRLRTIQERRVATATIVVLAWLAGEAVGILATRSTYDHYFLALVPPLILLAGLFFFKVLEASRWVTPAIALMLIWPIALSWQTLVGGIDIAAAASASRTLTKVGVPLDAPILVANRSMLAYLLSGRRPVSRYFHPQHLLCDFPAPDPDPLGRALDAHPAAVLMASMSWGMVCERSDRLDELNAALARDYCKAGHTVGNWDSYDVFIRREASWARCP